MTKHFGRPGPRGLLDLLALALAVLLILSALANPRPEAGPALIALALLWGGFHLWLSSLLGQAAPRIDEPLV